MIKMTLKPMDQAYNPNYSQGCDQENLNSLWVPISKITIAKWIGGTDQVVELLLCKYIAFSSNPSSTLQKYDIDKNVKSNRFVSL
jgi:hypothetical protein